MKCFSFFALFILSAYCYGKEYTLYSLSSQEVSFGDIVNFSTEEDTGLEDISHLRGNRVTEILYILDIKKKASGLEIQGILSEQAKDEKIEITDTIKVKGLNFKYQKINLKEGFDVIDSQIKLIKSKTTYIIMLITFLIIFIFGLKKVLIKKEKLKELKKIRKNLSLLSDKENRELYEKIYNKRNEVLRVYSFDEKLMKDFLNELNKIQYKEDWSEVEASHMKGLYKELKNTFKESNGI